jgi:ABC-type Fe3+/spermidine/putrescine transport system ATPase subunit
MLTVRDVARSFDGAPALRGVSLEVPTGEIFCLLGPSGCGKTTLLRIIAGLEQLDSGFVEWDGQDIMPVPVHQRGFGLMFQDFALFPHLDVAGNVLFGLKMSGVSLEQQRTRLREVLELVGLTGFEKRDVARLSGGERQRVALARSLAPNPKLLMLDEPLGSLDAALRERLVVELRDIIKRVGLTAVYVTHDHREAFAIADRIAIMNAGHIEQVGAPQAVYRRPATAFVARFLGLNNIVPVESQAGEVARTPLGNFRLMQQASAVLLHPDGIHLDPGGSIGGVVAERTFQGDVFRLLVQTPSGIRLTAKLPASAEPIPAAGDAIAMSMDPAWVIPLA